MPSNCHAGARRRTLAIALSGALVVISARPAAAAPDWVVQFGEDYIDQARTVAIDPAGNVLVGGLWGGWDGFVGKYDATGRRMWIRTISAPEGGSNTQVNGITADASGNVIVAAATSGSLAAPRRGLDDVFVAKYAPSGRIIWRRQFGRDRVDVATGVAVDRSGNTVIAGYTDGSVAGPNVVGDEDGWIARYSPAGARVWLLQFGSDEDERIEDVAVDPSGRAYVAGSTWSNLARPPQYYDGFLARFPAD
jgi:hypothetical protein